MHTPAQNALFVVLLLPIFERAKSHTVAKAEVIPKSHILLQ